MSPLVVLMFGAIGLILILMGLTIAKQMMERKQGSSSGPKRRRTTLGKDLSEE